MNKNSLIADFRHLYGLSSTQLSHRLGISQSSLSRLEKSEREGGITISSLQRAADALGCRFEYRFVPLKKDQGMNSDYHGMKRSSKSTSTREGKLSEQLREDEVQLYRSMTGTERLNRAFDLSDFARDLSS